MHIPMGKKPYFNQEFYDSLLEEGYGQIEAIRVASTEMDGVNTTHEGMVDGNQTNCDVLNHDENLPSSKGQEEGKKETLRGLVKFFGSSKDLNKEVDTWIENRSGQLK